MNGSFRLVAPFVAALAIAGCNAGGSSNIPASTAGAPAGASAITQHIPVWMAKHQAHTLCPQVVGKPSCQALEVNRIAQPNACNPSSGCGYTPAELETAYGLTSSLGKGSGTIVALIEAGDYATLSTDLGTYRSQYGLGTASFNKYNENGQMSNYPPSCQDYGWCGETALDVDMVSAACPDCTIDVIEAKDGSSISDFETAEATAVSLGATIVSNSWSCPKNWDCGDASGFASYFNVPGVTFLASSGDSGYNTVGGPSVLQTVIAVGGTQLHKSGSTYTESVWVDASAGCSSPSNVGSPGVAKPSWQHDPDCAYRTDADVSAESGCTPGVAVYTSIYGGWSEYCGTSVASPFTAGILALAGNAASENGGENFWNLKKKLKKTELHDITSGSDGGCGATYLCEAGLKKKHGGYKTYSGPAGWGTPEGIAAY